MPIDQAALQDLLDELATTHGVPGASVAVLTPEGMTVAATGVLNVTTEHAATPDSLFQIGSITKPYTASMVARLVDRGELDLDEPVLSYLPEFRVADETATRSTTLRHLLSHSSGIDGDHFLDTGRGDDVLERFVASCADLRQLFPAGASHSYCNAGYGILGRLLEKVTGKVWDQVLRDEVLTPLGLASTVTLPEECLRYGTACGHLGVPGQLVLTPQWVMPRSSGPAGLINATAADVVAFAQAFLRQGESADGSTWLSPEAVAAMLEPQVDVPNPYTLGDSWALGWILYNAVDGRTVYGHDGATLGQGASLRLVPDSGVAVAVMGNGGGTTDLNDAVVRAVLRESAGIEMRAGLAPVEGATGGDRSTQVGRYVGTAMTNVFEELDDAGLRLTFVVTSEVAQTIYTEPIVVDLLPVREDVYVGKMPGSEAWTPFVFCSLPDGSRGVHFGARLTLRS